MEPSAASLSPAHQSTVPGPCSGRASVAHTVSVCKSVHSWRSYCPGSDGQVKLPSDHMWVLMTQLWPSVSPTSSPDATPRAVCHFNGKTYMDEERWDIDSCTHCYCLQGQTLCSTVSCPVLPCHQPVTVEGSCCPMCPGQDLCAVCSHRDE